MYSVIVTGAKHDGFTALGHLPAEVTKLGREITWLTCRISNYVHQSGGGEHGLAFDEQIPILDNCDDSWLVTPVGIPRPTFV